MEPEEVLVADAPKKRHRRTALEIERSFKCDCPGCPKSYGSEGALKMHIKLKHPDHQRNKNSSGTPNSIKKSSGNVSNMEESDSPTLPSPIQPISMDGLVIQPTAAAPHQQVVNLSTSVPIPMASSVGLQPPVRPPSLGASPRHGPTTSPGGGGTFTNFTISKDSVLKTEKPPRYKFLNDSADHSHISPDIQSTASANTPHTPHTPVTPADYPQPVQPTESAPYTPVVTTTSPSTSLIIAHLKIGQWERGSYSPNDIVARFAHDDHVVMWEIEEFDTRQRIAFAFDAITSLRVKFSSQYTAYAVIFELNTPPRFFRCPTYGPMRWAEVEDWLGTGNLQKHTIILRQDPSDALDYVFASHPVCNELWRRARLPQSRQHVDHRLQHPIAHPQPAHSAQPMVSHLPPPPPPVGLTTSHTIIMNLPPPPVVPVAAASVAAKSATPSPAPSRNSPAGRAMPPPPLVVAGGAPIVSSAAHSVQQHPKPYQQQMPLPGTAPPAESAVTRSRQHEGPPLPIAGPLAGAHPPQQPAPPQKPQTGHQIQVATISAPLMGQSNLSAGSSGSSGGSLGAILAQSFGVGVDPLSAATQLFPDDFLLTEAGDILPGRNSASSSFGRGSGLLRGMPSSSSSSSSRNRPGSDVFSTVNSVLPFESPTSSLKIASDALSDPFTQGLLSKPEDAMGSLHLHPSRAEHLLFMQEYQSRSSGSSRGSSGPNSNSGSLNTGSANKDAPLHLF